MIRAVVTIILLTGLFYACFVPPKPVPAPPHWQCNGPADTRHPDCPQ